MPWCDNRFGVHMGTLRVSLSEPGQLPQLVQNLVDKAYGENWRQVTVLEVWLVVVNMKRKAEKQD